MKGSCMYCNTDIEMDFCCDGRECGCMGIPIDPPICQNDKCYEKFKKDMELNKKSL